MTTIVSVRRNGKVVIAGDGQVSLGNTVMKGNARKVRRYITIKYWQVLLAVLLMHSLYLSVLSVSSKCTKATC